MDDRKSPGQQEQFLLERDRKADILPGSGSDSGSCSSKRSVSPSKKALRIKLKVSSHDGNGSIPDFRNHEEEEGHKAHNHNQSSGKENRICKVCKKGFSSGRALGGHMRVHAQMMREKRQDDEEEVQFQDINPISPDTFKNNITSQITPNKHHHGNKKNHVIGSYGGAAGRPMNSTAHVHSKSMKMMKTTIHHNSSSNNPSCFLCEKNFRSMKSLFGHMRCHPERDWRGIQPPPPPSPSASPSDPPPPLAAPKTTSISSASTLSDKDSSGSAYRYHHHGGKLKRKKTADDHQLGSFLSSTARSAINLAESLSSWSITAKRGRQAIHAAVPPPCACACASASASSEEQQPMPTDADIDAAYQLMMLSHGNSVALAFPSPSYPYSSSDRIEGPLQTMGDLSKKRRRDDNNDDGDGHESQTAGARNSEYLPKPIIRRVEEEEDDEEEEGKSGGKTSTDDDYSSIIRGHQPDESDQLSCMFEMALGQKVKKQTRTWKKKKMKLRDLESVVMVEMGSIDCKLQQQQHDPTRTRTRTTTTTTVTLLSDRFKCRTCNKTFPSHQALGGHRSSHKMGKNIPITNTTDVDDDLAINPKSTGEEGEEESKSQTQSPYRCKICSKTFPTGQALGGHQRCHWAGPAEAAPSSSVASPEEDINKGGERMMLDFDLNEMPAPAMEEEDDDESG